MHRIEVVEGDLRDSRAILFVKLTRTSHPSSVQFLRKIPRDRAVTSGPDPPIPVGAGVSVCRFKRDPRSRLDSSVVSYASALTMLAAAIAATTHAARRIVAATTRFQPAQ